MKTLAPAKPKLTAEQHAELTKLVHAGPDSARNGVERWQRLDLFDEFLSSIHPVTTALP